MISFTPVNLRTWSLLGQCGTYGKILSELAAENEKIWSLTADQGTPFGLQRFQAAYPDRFLNLGISEQNAVEVAAGLANEGYIPFLAFQAAFASNRCADQVRVCMSYMGMNVKLIGAFSGVTLCDYGPTHYSLQDFALFRSFPNMVILSPADAAETVKVLIAAAQIDAPVYLRLGSGSLNIPMVYRRDYDFKIGKAVTLKEGKNICILATGTMVHHVLKASEQIEAECGATVKVVNMHTIKPLDLQAVKDACSADLIVSVEEHSIYGGLGGAIAEMLALEKHRPPHLIIGTQDDYANAGEYESVLEHYGLTIPLIVQRINSIYKELF